MTFDEFMQKVLNLFPNAIVDDSGDEIVISTGLVLENDVLVPITEWIK